MKKFLTIIFLLNCFLGFAQTGSISISLPSNPSPNMANWTSPPLTIVAQVPSNPAANLNVEIKALAFIRQGDKRVCGTFTEKTAPNAGYGSNTPVKTWVGSSALGLFGDECTLQPGQYELCVQLYNNGRLLNETCKPFSIEDTKSISYSGPTLIFPENAKVFKPEEKKLPITFRWTPLVPKPNERITYKLSVWQIMDKQAGPQAMRANSPIIEKEVTNMTQAMINNIDPGACIPPNTCSYIWRVDAINADEKIIASSEPSTFSYGSPCSPDYEMTDIKVICENGKVHVTGRVVINPKSSITINQIHLTVVKEFNAQGANLATDITASNAILTPNGNSYPFSFYLNSPFCNNPVFIAYDINYSCSNSVDPEPPLHCGEFSPIIPCCTQVCDCGKWSPIVINGANYKCGEKIDWKCNNKIDFKASFSCSLPQPSTCQANMYWFITKDGSMVASGSGINTINQSYTPTSNGTYTISLDGVCGTKKCPPCMMTFVVKDCKPNCCTGSKWLKKVYANSSGQKISSDNCNEKLGTYKCKSTIPFNSAYQCAEGCGDAKLRYTIFDSNSNTSVGTSINVGNGVTANLITPNASGSYYIKIEAICGDTICNTCMYYFDVDCGAVADCCKGSKWVDKILSHFNSVGNTEITKIECEQVYKLTRYDLKNLKFIADFQCNPDLKNCKKELYVEITNPAGTKLTRPLPLDAEGLIVEGGTYKICLVAKCNGEVCATCCFTIVTDNKIDCCKDSKWLEKSFSYTSVSNRAQTIKLDCDKVYNINAVDINSFTFNADFQCNPEFKDCKKELSVEITGANGSTTTHALPYSVSLREGQYKICYVAKCGGIVCDKCCFTVNINGQKDCCKGSQWVNKYYAISSPILKTAPVQINCNQEYVVDQIPNGTLMLNADYQCNPNIKDCDKLVTAEITNAAGMTISKTLPYNISLNEPGQYKICYVAKCGGVACDSCCFTIIVKNKIDCCLNSRWGYCSFPGLISLKSGCPINGVTGAIPTFPIGSNISFVYNYLCNPANLAACKSRIKYEIVNQADGTIFYSQTFASGENVKLILPNVAGKFCMTAYAYCGDSPEPCNKCKVCFETVCINCDRVNINDTSDGNSFVATGTISSGPRLIKFVSAQLVTVSADNNGSSYPPPQPNFEFVQNSSSIGGPINMPFSLTGSRSNIAQSTFSAPNTSVPYKLFIKDDYLKKLKSFNIKFTIFFDDGSYCEKEISRQF